MARPVTRSVRGYEHPKPHGSYPDLVANHFLPIYSRFKTDALERFVAKVTAPELWRTKSGKPRKEAAFRTLWKEGAMVEFVCLMGLLEAQNRGLVSYDPGKSRWRITAPA